MAPPPEYDKEPKAPDKSATNLTCEETKALHNLVNDHQTNSDNKSSSTAASTEVENNKLIETLDDGQLRALLDEAITYKCPKDREGKSSLFKELLEEVEQDEQASEAAARGLSGNRAAVNRACAVTSGRGSRSRRALPHSNSLQDLVAALAAEPAPRRHHRAPPAPAPAPVSARAIHGGSLPSGVDTSFLLGEEPARGAGYLATVRCVNPPPLGERRVSTDANCSAELDSLTRRSKPAFPMTYTARATLEIGSGAVCSGRAVTTTTASNQVDSAIPFSCITTPEVVASCNTTASTSQSAVAVDPKPLQLASSYRAVASLVEPARAASPPRAASPSPPAPAPAARAASADQPRSVISSSFNGLPLTRPNYGSTGSTTQDEYKSIDENGNSVQGFSSPLSGSSQHKKPRRKKSSKNETVIKSHQIDGYQGNKDLNEVLRFIESAADTSRAGKLGRAKHRDDADDKGGKKRSGTRKDKESKMKRATSMEELSCSRMEDLTDKPSPPARAPRHSDQAKAERRSWGDDARDAATRFFREEPLDAALVPDTEFQTVTKKRKPRRRADEPAAGDPPRPARPPEARARRVSAPPSDRSNDSNDDMDSVHSLPADAAAGRTAAPVSYADIARTRHNIPDLIESCNFYSEGERERGERVECPAGVECLAGGGGGGAGVAGDADGYPALEPRASRAPPPAAPPAPPTKHRDARPRTHRKVERTESAVLRNNGSTVAPLAVAEWPAPDVVADRRPAVILLDSAAQARDMDGVTFGFDINETLLGGPARRPRCDLIRDAIEVTAIPVASNGVAEGGVAVAAGCAALRYVPPAPLPLTAHLHQIIDYVGGAWEDVVRCGAGKVHYFSE